MKSGQITDILYHLTAMAHVCQNIPAIPTMSLANWIFQKIMEFQLMLDNLLAANFPFLSKSSFQNEPIHNEKSIKPFYTYSTNLLYSSVLCVYNVFLSGSGQERAACSDHLQGHHVHSAVHQKLLPVGERSEEPASLPGELV